MKRFLFLLFVLVFGASPAFAAYDTLEGTAITTSTSIEGNTGGSIEGGSVTAGGADYYATNSWTSQATLAIQASVCDVGDQASITNMPIALIWTGSAATSNMPLEPFDSDGSYPYLSASGGDIRFHNKADPNTANDGRLDAELVSIAQAADPSTVTAEIHVEVDSISCSVDTPIYMFWGKASQTWPAEGDSYGKHAAWGNSWAMVHHMTGASATALDDSTSNNNDVTGDSGSPTGYNATGKLGQAVAFDGNNDDLRVNDAASLEPTDFTLCAWANSNTGISTDKYILGKKYQTSEVSYGLAIDNGTNDYFLFAGYDTGWWSKASAGTQYDDNAWHYVCGTQSGTTNKLYVDGAEESGSATGGSNFDTGFLHIGSFVNSLGYWNGEVDEIRISSIARTLGWIKAEYRQMNDINTYIVEGAREAP